MTYNTTASLDNLSCNEYVDFGKCENIFGQFFWSKKDSNYLDVKHKLFKRIDKKDFGLVQSLTMGEADFKQFMRLRNQLVIAAENIAREENLYLLLLPTMFRDTDEQLKLAHKVVDVARIEQTERFVWLCCGKVWTSQTEFLRSSPKICKVKGGWEVSTICLFE